MTRLGGLRPRALTDAHENLPGRLKVVRRSVATPLPLHDVGREHHHAQNGVGDAHEPEEESGKDVGHVRATPRQQDGGVLGRAPSPPRSISHPASPG